MILDISRIIAQNRSHEVLSHAWIEWRKASGNQYKQDYIDFIDINNDGAHSLGTNIGLNLIYIYIYIYIY